MRCIDIPRRYVPSYRLGSSRSGPQPAPARPTPVLPHSPAAPLCSQLFSPRQYL